MGSLLGGEMPSKIDAKGLIIDLRGYPNYTQIKGYFHYDLLYPHPTYFAIMSWGSISYPGLFTFYPFQPEGKENKDYYKGKKVILVNEMTQSQAEFLTMKYKCSPNTIVIGSTTAGADGNVSMLVLPGNINVSFTGLGVYYPNFTETQQIGIIPDIEVHQTIKGIREGRDEVLEFAIKYLNQSKKFNKDNNTQVSKEETIAL